MKKVFFIVMVIYSIFFLAACTNQANINKDSDNYLRIHIRANSNIAVDQNVKYTIKDQIINFLTPIVAKCNSFNEVKLALNSNLQNIQSKVNDILLENQFSYTSNVKLNNEFFPTRYYEDKVLVANYYDALIIELGLAEGDNWWCVVYPPLCFLNAQGNYGESFVYKSKIIELINKFFES